MKLNKVLNNFAFLSFFFVFVFVVITNYVSILFYDKVYTFNLIAVISVICTFFLIFQILFYLLKEINIINDVFLMLVIFFIFYIFAWSSLNFVSSNDYFVSLATVQSFELIILWMALIFIGYNLNFDSKLKYTILFAIIICFISTFIFVMKTNTLIIYTKLFFENEEVGVGYQYLSRAILISIIFLSAYFVNNLLKNLLLIAGAIVLFTIGSRSEFFAFLFAMFFMLHIDFLKSKFSIKNLILVFLVYFVSFFIVYKYSSILLESRFSEILDMSNSSSWSAREHSQILTIDNIKFSPLLGVYGSHINDYGVRGYSHNILSAWVNYGFIGFALYLVINVYSFVYSLSEYLKFREYKMELWLILILSLIMLILCFSSKAIFWPLPALVWGFLLKYKLQSRYYIG
ncbi:hypothetical protein [Acinetobacter indicus]|uniref:hypothetical protein n=1 Tax=Acinetobacter indicus TaxID=756892 RepID=UPI000CEB9E60|nr:hypothetical protein [Acinetobacter indicus]